MEASMRGFRAFACVLALVLVIAGAGCSNKPSAQTEPVAQTPPPLPTATPTPAMDEEVVSEPITETVISEEVMEEIPEDLEILNARGYLEDVFFETDSYEIPQEYRDSLARNASWLQRYPSIRIMVEGHCDERNTREYNLALGERRAYAVRDYLIFLGIEADRISTISYGEERPFALGSDESAWRLNRRAHFRITAR
jgi:peptidoglycan-associated lipoprotein